MTPPTDIAVAAVMAAEPASRRVSRTEFELDEPIPGSSPGTTPDAQRGPPRTSDL